MATEGNIWRWTQSKAEWPHTIKQGGNTVCREAAWKGTSSQVQFWFILFFILPVLYLFELLIYSCEVCMTLCTNGTPQPSGIGSSIVSACLVTSSEHNPCLCQTFTVDWLLELHIFSLNMWRAFKARLENKTDWWRRELNMINGSDGGQCGWGVRGMNTSLESTQYIKKTLWQVY